MKLHHSSRKVKSHDCSLRWMQWCGLCYHKENDISLALTDAITCGSRHSQGPQIHGIDVNQHGDTTVRTACEMRMEKPNIHLHYQCSISRCVANDFSSPHISKVGSILCLNFGTNPAISGIYVLLCRTQQWWTNFETLFQHFIALKVQVHTKDCQKSPLVWMYRNIGLNAKIRDMVKWATIWIYTSDLVLQNQWRIWKPWEYWVWRIKSSNLKNYASDVRWM